jgi:hypothetical protein
MNIPELAQVLNLPEEKIKCNFDHLAKAGFELTIENGWLVVKSELFVLNPAGIIFKIRIQHNRNKLESPWPTNIQWSNDDLPEEFWYGCCLDEAAYYVHRALSNGDIATALTLIANAWIGVNFPNGHVFYGTGGNNHPKMGEYWEREINKYKDPRKKT